MLRPPLRRRGGGKLSCGELEHAGHGGHDTTRARESGPIACVASPGAAIGARGPELVSTLNLLHVHGGGAPVAAPASSDWRPRRELPPVPRAPPMLARAASVAEQLGCRVARGREKQVESCSPLPLMPVELATPLECSLKCPQEEKGKGDVVTLPVSQSKVCICICTTK